MFIFGQLVRIKDKELKSYDKVGVFVGISHKGFAKVYLKEPIVTKKNKVSCITVSTDKIEVCPKSEREKILNRLEEIDKEMSKLDNEMELLKNEAFTLELKIMMGQEW